MRLLERTSVETEVVIIFCTRFIAPLNIQSERHETCDEEGIIDGNRLVTARKVQLMKARLKQQLQMKEFQPFPVQKLLQNVLHEVGGQELEGLLLLKQWSFADETSVQTATDHEIRAPQIHVERDGRDAAVFESRGRHVARHSRRICFLLPTIVYFDLKKSLFFPPAMFVAREISKICSDRSRPVISSQNRR